MVDFGTTPMLGRCVMSVCVVWCGVEHHHPRYGCACAPADRRTVVVLGAPKYHQLVIATAELSSRSLLLLLLLWWRWCSGDYSIDLYMSAGEKVCGNVSRTMHTKCSLSSTTTTTTMLKTALR